MQISIGNKLTDNLGRVTFEKEDRNVSWIWAFGVSLLVLFSVVFFIAVVLYKKRRDSKQQADRRERERYMEEEHIAAANASRNGKFLLVN